MKLEDALVRSGNGTACSDNLYRTVFSDKLFTEGRLVFCAKDPFETFRMSDLTFLDECEETRQIVETTEDWEPVWGISPLETLARCAGGEEG